MGFTTQIFLFCFFPLSIAAYALAGGMQKIRKLAPMCEKIRLKDLTLIGIGLVFYMWAGLNDLFRLLMYILLVYALGRWIEQSNSNGFSLVLERMNEEREKKQIPIAVVILFFAVTLIVGILIISKYTGMLARVWNYIFKDTVNGKSAAALLGISFITFSAISYLADIYMKKAPAGNLIDCMLYMTFFPKVVSGPIVLWRDFQEQITNRKVTLTGISDGVGRMMIGFAKKLILADSFGAYIASTASAVDVPTAFWVSLLYMLQIYFDFSGYSDVAIGLSKMFGFSVRENFDFPYLSCSITEFWRRWHISLGTWFREYIYFPLGGSRKGKRRTVLNIGIVFLLTGIWHGAGWTYMLWGIVNGLCNIAEKLLSEKRIYQKTPKLVKWALTMMVTFFCWELFRFSGGTECKDWFLTMFGLKTAESIPYGWQYYIDAQSITLVTIGVLGATVFGLPKIQQGYQKLIRTKCGYILHGIAVLLLFSISIMFMVNSQYSPFIYFQY